MKQLLLSTFLFSAILINAQDQKVSTFQFAEILNENREEALFYFKNNWKQLRELAIEKEIIDSYQLHETTYSEDSPFHLILITTYTDQAQYEKREENFEKIMEGRELKLLNDKQPGDFRKTVFVAEGAVLLESGVKD